MERNSKEDEEREKERKREIRGRLLDAVEMEE